MKKGLTDICYGFFSTLANPTRLAILEKLIDGPMSVNQIVDSIGQEQSMVSHNLKPLVRCNFVNVNREGKKRVYSLNTQTIEPIFNLMKNHASNYCKEEKCPIVTNKTPDPRRMN